MAYDNKCQCGKGYLYLTYEKNALWEKCTACGYVFEKKDRRIGQIDIAFPDRRASGLRTRILHDLKHIAETVNRLQEAIRVLISDLDQVERESEGGNK